MCIGITVPSSRVTGYAYIRTGAVPVLVTTACSTLVFTDATDPTRTVVLMVSIAVSPILSLPPTRNTAPASW